MMLDDVTATRARSIKTRKLDTNQPLREVAPLWTEELENDESSDAQSKEVFWDGVAIVAVTVALLVGGAIGVPLGCTCMAYCRTRVVSALQLFYMTPCSPITALNSALAQ